MNALYLAYFLPYRSGTGVPGAKRVERMVRYLPFAKHHILGVDHGDPAPDVGRLPQNVEITTARESRYFDAIAAIKRKLTGARARPDQEAQQGGGTASPGDGTVKEGRWAVIKDNCSAMLTYPDFAYGWLGPAVRRGMRICRREKIDVVFATGMPWTALIVGMVLKRLLRVRLIVDFRDPWVDNPFIEKPASQHCMDRFWEARVVAAADLVVLNTETLLSAFKQRYPRYAEKMLCVPNGYDPQDFAGIRPKRVESSEHEFQIVHTGFLYLKRDPLPVLHALAKVRDKGLGNHVRFVHVGKLWLSYDVDEVCRRLGVDGLVRWKGEVSYEEALGYMAGADALLLIQQGTTTQVPSKFYEYVFFKKPIIAITEANGALADRIRSYPLGWVFTELEVDAIAECVVALARGG